jgi:Prp8 binding protein
MSEAALTKRGGELVEAGASKRARVDTAEEGTLQALQAGTVPRTSSLDAPTMQLTGHSDAVFSLKFSASGAHLASGGRDHNVQLWKVHGECKARQSALRCGTSAC